MRSSFFLRVRCLISMFALARAVGLWTKQNSFYFQSESFNNHLEGNIAYNGNQCLASRDDSKLFCRALSSLSLSLSRARGRSLSA